MPNSYKINQVIKNFDSLIKSAAGNTPSIKDVTNPSSQSSNYGQPLSASTPTDAAFKKMKAQGIASLTDQEFQLLRTKLDAATYQKEVTRRQNLRKKAAVNNYWKRLETNKPRRKFAGTPASAKESAQKVVDNILNDTFIKGLTQAQLQTIKNETDPQAVKAALQEIYRLSENAPPAESTQKGSDKLKDARNQLQDVIQVFDPLSTDTITLMQPFPTEAERDKDKPKPQSYVSPKVIKTFQTHYNSVCWDLGGLPIFESSKVDSDTAKAKLTAEKFLVKKNYLSSMGASWQKVNQALKQYIDVKSYKPEPSIQVSGPPPEEPSTPAKPGAFPTGSTTYTPPKINPMPRTPSIDPKTGLGVPYMIGY